MSGDSGLFMPCEHCPPDRRNDVRVANWAAQDVTCIPCAKRLAVLPPMTTRDVLRWNLGPGGVLGIARVVAGAVLLGLLERVMVRLEAWVDR